MPSHRENLKESSSEAENSPATLEKASADLEVARAKLDLALQAVSKASKELDQCAEAMERALLEHVGKLMPLEGEIRSVIWASDGREEGVLDWEADPMNGHPSTRHFSEEVRVVEVQPNLGGVIIDSGEDGANQYKVVTASVKVPSESPPQEVA
jgi:hypothetical protein